MITEQFLINKGFTKNISYDSDSLDGKYDIKMLTFKKEKTDLSIEVTHLFIADDAGNWQFKEQTVWLCNDMDGIVLKHIKTELELEFLDLVIFGTPEKK